MVMKRKDMTMKKLFVLLSGLLIAISSGCASTPSNQSSTTVVETNEATPVVVEASVDELDRSTKIEPTVLYDQDGIKITANELVYGNYGVDLMLTFENSSEIPVNFVAGSIGYSVNSVNGYMVEDGYVNVDVEPDKVANEAMNFSYDNLMLYGIYTIKQIQVGFDISDEDYNSIYTGPIQISTSADNGMIETKGYVENIQSAGIQNKYGYTIDYVNNQTVMEINGVTIQSEVIITNPDGKKGLTLEAVNTTDQPVKVSLRNIYFNDVCAHDGTWTTTTVNPGKVGVLTMTLDNVVNELLLPYYGLTNNPSTITVTVGTENMDYDETGPTGDLIITNPNGDTSYDGDGTIVYSDDAIDLIYKGMVNEDDILESTHLMFLVNNKSGETIHTSVDYDSLSINGYMMDTVFGSVEVKPGLFGIMEFSVDGEDLSANGISPDTISNVEFRFDYDGDTYELNDQTITMDLSE